MATAEHALNLARQLPPRLQRFFMHNPPTAIYTSPRGASQPLPQAEGSEPAKTILNPFSAHKNTKTGKWHPPIYSLRRQADLVKMAEKYGVGELLPYTTKTTAEQRRKRDELGLRVKGTGLGQRVKGHEWERTLKSRLDKRRQAMLDMPRMIYEWKLVRFL